MNNLATKFQDQISPNSEAEKIWNQFSELVRQNVSELKFNTWFKPIRPVSVENGRLLVNVPSSDYFEMIVTRFGDIVNRALKSVMGDNASIAYEIDSSLSYSDSYSLSSGDSDINRANEISVQESVAVSGTKCFLNPEYTFDTFVKGKNNEFAYAAAFSISERPGTQYNPLMIYGGVGLGKTHLMQAIGNHIKLSTPGASVMYISGPEFTTSFVQSIRFNKAHEFEKFYKSLDVLIVDDVQFFEGKNSTQDSFFQIFNSLYQLKKQIVLSSDKPPHELVGLEERLITRFQWGLSVDIQPPDLETRIAILFKKCELENFSIPYEVAEFIALNIKDNIRSLEGCLKSIIFDSELTGQTVSIDMAKRSVLKFGGIKNRKVKLDIGTIISVVSKYFNLEESLLRLKSKQQEIVLARHTAMYLSKELTGASLQTIGAHFGGRNHATVIHACKCIEDNINTNPSFREKIEEIKGMLLTN
ncbi:MAG: chromosomal replication initiator protein DnaA [Ignavibacteria bacterium]|nr:chromosomal replication initiator protein DnaA [Ignavibacteria bacterium]